MPPHPEYDTVSELDEDGDGELFKIPSIQLAIREKKEEDTGKGQHSHFSG